MKPMVKSGVRALALGLWLGAISVFPGCGSSRSSAAIPEGGDAEVPAVVAAQLRACAEERKTHLGATRHTISFELHFSEDGQVDSLSLDDSTLEDQGLEACMASVLRSDGAGHAGGRFILGGADLCARGAVELGETMATAQTDCDGNADGCPDAFHRDDRYRLQTGEE